MRDPSRFLGAYLPEDRRRALARGVPLAERQQARAADALERLAEERVRGRSLGKGLEILDRVIALLPEDATWLERRIALTVRCATLRTRRADLATARQMAESALGLAEERQDPGQRAEAFALDPQAYRLAVEKGAATRIEDARHGSPEADVAPDASGRSEPHVPRGPTGARPGGVAKKRGGRGPQSLR